MEELQDAIEDAQYMNAMHDEGPRPTKDWSWLQPDIFHDYINRLERTNPDAFDVENMCKNCLGFYLFMKFCRESGSSILVNFLTELAIFRLRSSLNSFQHAQKIIDDYIIDGSTGTTLSDLNQNQLCKLKRDIKVNRNHLQINTYYKLSGNNAINISGEIISNTIQRFNISSNKSKVNEDNLQIDGFDELDTIIYKQLKELHSENFVNTPDWVKYFQFLSMAENKLSEQHDFHTLRVLGRGGFGIVHACRKNTTGKLFAMKTLSKKRIKLKKAQKLCLSERNILTLIDSPYVVCLRYAMSSPTELYLVLDLMMGGDLGYMLSKKITFSPFETKYYAARIILGISALHSLRIVYRDLKPENILMDSEGFTKISDLGLACQLDDIDKGMTGACGTRGYWAPEMLRRNSEGKRERYGLCVDWFSLGCCLYEFLIGIGPFRTRAAINWGDFPKIDKADQDKGLDLATMEMEPDLSDISDNITRDFLAQLLQKDPRHRLGYKGYKEVMNHPYFDGFNFGTLDMISPPIRPGKDINVASQGEIGEFRDEKELKKLFLTEEDQKYFEEWDFISIPSFLEEVVDFISYEEIKGPIRRQNTKCGCCLIF